MINEVVLLSKTRHRLVSNTEQLDEITSLKKPVKTTLQDALKPLLDYYGRQTLLDEIEEIESKKSNPTATTTNPNDKRQ